MNSVPPYGQPPNSGQFGSREQQPPPMTSGPLRHPTQSPARADVGFFRTLFDFGFERFITRRAMAVIWGIIVTFIALASVMYVAIAFTQSTLVGLLSLVFVPVGALLYLIFWRLALEFLVVQFRQAELLEHIASKS